MKTVEGYIIATRTGVAKLFDGIESYREQLREGIAGSTFVTGTTENEATALAYDVWTQANLNALDRSEAAQLQFHEQRFAHAVLCGAVLEVACKAIELFSDNTEVPPEVSQLVGQARWRRFAIGRPVKGVPSGLAIYAGRNQHVHFNEEQLRRVNREIFDAMARHGMQEGFKDPGMDLDRYRGESIAANVIYLLGWFDLNAYEGDMARLFRGLAE